MCTHVVVGPTSGGVVTSEPSLLCFESGSLAVTRGWPMMLGWLASPRDRPVSASPALRFQAVPPHDHPGPHASTAGISLTAITITTE